MTFILGIIGLGFLVFFHESGHFIAARIFGVEVEAFSIGMGPVLLRRKIGKTEYRISLIPLGGYCAMKGEKDFKKAIEENLPAIESEPDSFYGINPFKRLLIAFAGPFFNYIFGFLAFFTVAIIGYTYYSAGTTVTMADEVYPELTSPAKTAGLRTGDQIVQINGKNTSDFSEIASIVSLHGNENLEITVSRDNELLTFTVHSDFDKETGKGKIGIVADKNSFVEREYRSKNVLEAAKEGFSQSFNVISATIRSIRILFKGIKITNAVSGPARITSMLGDTVQQGFADGVRTGIVSTLEFLALISISLFLTNLLPVPILDGGLIVFALIEGITGKKLRPKVLYYIQTVGFAFIATLMIIAIFGDVLYFMKK